MKRVLNLDDFDERAKDVSDYLCFLRDLEQGEILLSKDGATSKIDPELDKSLKATGKKNRNDLAHGFLSFNEVGKSTSAENLVEISERVIKYLRQILENIEEYLVNEEYLDSE